MNKFLRFCIFFGTAAVVIPMLMMADVQGRYLDRMVREIDPGDRIALVLGASIKKDKSPSEALQDRLEKGIELYQKGSVKQILLSGDDGKHRVNEISTMRRYMLERGIPEQNLLIDRRGYRTYESCKHARELFASDQTFIIVTQRFHLGRALYLCNQLGVKAFGVSADHQSYRRIMYFWMRDLAASVKAWWDIHVQPPTSPVID